VGRWSRIARRIRVPLGFAFAVVYFWLARPTVISLFAGGAIALVGIAIRAAASGHVRKNEELTTTGPYAYMRNPLYFGSIVLALGFAVAARSVWIVMGMAAIFAAIYWPVIRSEEAFLRERFPEYQEYARNVPRLLPRLTAYAAARGAFSWELYWQHREYNALLGAVAMMAALAIKSRWWPIA
jgi:protein-S-isoprenylcysteine O-methyltransferase Ste14